MTDWSKLTVVQLRGELKKRSLPQAGKKTEMVARLEEHEAHKNAVTEEGVDGADQPEAKPKAAPAVDDDKDAFVPKLAPELEVAAEPSRAPTDDAAAVDPHRRDVDAPSRTSKDASAPLLETTPTEEIPRQEEPVTELPQVPPIEILQDAQKRKRRSNSPVSSEDLIATKRVKHEDNVKPETAPTEDKETAIALASDAPQNANQPQLETQPEPSKTNGHASATSPDLPSASFVEEQQQPTFAKTRDLTMRDHFDESQMHSGSVATESEKEESRAAEKQHVAVENYATDEKHQVDSTDRMEEDHRDEEQREAQYEVIDYERDVEPSIHPATSALYIRDFMRPLRPDAVRAHLLDLATPAGKRVNPEEIEEFFLDPIRTHAFVIFTTVTAASRVRTALHDTVWPQETTRKKLWVDYVPTGMVLEWIRTEEGERGGGRGSAGTRWEVVYGRDGSGNVTAELSSGLTAPPARPAAPAAPPTGKRDSMSGSSANVIPLGPRSQRGSESIPSGPRSRPIPTSTQSSSRSTNTTTARPNISYQPVSEELAQRRLKDMRSYYTNDTQRDPGKDINRYTFENQDQFVDRGKEVFVGIRPPYRQREVERRRREEAAGFSTSRRTDFDPPPRRRGPYRPRSDRYLPERGPDRISRYGADDDRRDRDNRREYRSRR